MSFFISDALAQPASAATPESSLLSFLPLIGIFVLFYFLLIRPQVKRTKEHKTLLGALAKGDEIVTGGGVLGRITEVGDGIAAFAARRLRTEHRIGSQQSRFALRSCRQTQ